MPADFISTRTSWDWGSASWSVRTSNGAWGASATAARISVKRRAPSRTTWIGVAGHTIGCSSTSK